MQDIVNFYKTFDRYKPFDSDDIANHIQQSYDNKQYKVFKDDEIYGYANWAFVDKDTEDTFLKTGIIDDWKCGDIMLHVDFIATKNVKHIMSWLKNNSVKELGTNKQIHWVRLNAKNKIRSIMKQTTKDNWSWAV